MNEQMERTDCRLVPAWEYGERDDSAGTKRQAASGSSIWTCVVFLLLSGFLLFAHGCHGDEDTELFTSTQFMTTK
jgi:hypothetical protein